MDETFTITAIILSRQPFRENDSRVLVYSKERGKMALVARGTNTVRSKLAGHIEPFCYSDLMVARGRQYNYIAGASSRDSFSGIREDLEKLIIAGQACGLAKKILKEDYADETIFYLLQDFLSAVSVHDLMNNCGLFGQAFVLKLACCLGYQPELYSCVVCGKAVSQEKNCIDMSAGGLICADCQKGKSLTISTDSIKLLRFLAEENFDNISKLHIQKTISAEVIRNITLFFNYNCN